MKHDDKLAPEVLAEVVEAFASWEAEGLGTCPEIQFTNYPDAWADIGRVLGVTATAAHATVCDALLSMGEALRQAEGNLARLAADMHKDADERTSTESAVCYCSTPPHSGEDHYKEGMTT